VFPGQRPIGSGELDELCTFDFAGPGTARARS
jgi:hypothetical protein